MPTASSGASAVTPAGSGNGSPPNAPVGCSTTKGNRCASDEFALRTYWSRLASVMSARDLSAVYNHTVAMTAGLVGWFICSMFASVAYNWTFYYVLALIVSARELTRDRLLAAQALQNVAKKGMSVPGRKAPRKMVSGVA